MLDKVQLITGGMAVDDRGSVCFVNDFDFAGVRRSYIVENHQTGFIRAWHAHKQEGKYVMVVRGAAIVVAVRIENWENPPRDSLVQRYVLSEFSPAVLWIPPSYANGFKTLTPNTKVMFFSTSTLEESKGDDVRWSSDWFGDVWTIIER